MSHILCPILAPTEIDSLLFDWLHNETELTSFCSLLVSRARMEDCDPTAKEDEESTFEHARQTLVVLVQARIQSAECRERFIRTEMPQDDFVQEELASWGGLILAVMFASDRVVLRICAQTPTELLIAALHTLPPEHQQAGREIFCH